MRALLLNFLVAFSQTAKFDEQRNKWGCVDSSGEWIIKPEFDSIGEFTTRKNGFAYAIVSKKGKWGLISSTGKKTDAGISFDSIWPMPHSKAGNYMVRSKNKIGIISPYGTYIFKPQFDNINPLISNKGRGYVMTKGNKQGYFDINEQLLIPIDKHSITGLTTITDESFISIKKGKFTSLYNLGGEVIIPTSTYSDVNITKSSDLFVVTGIDGLGLYSKKESKEVVTTKYDTIEYICTQPVVFKLKNKNSYYDIYDKSGRALVIDFPISNIEEIQFSSQSVPQSTHYEIIAPEGKYYWHLGQKGAPMPNMNNTIKKYGDLEIQTIKADNKIIVNCCSFGSKPINGFSKEWVYVDGGRLNNSYYVIYNINHIPQTAVLSSNGEVIKSGLTGIPSLKDNHLVSENRWMVSPNGTIYDFETTSGDYWIMKNLSDNKYYIRFNNSTTIQPESYELCKKENEYVYLKRNNKWGCLSNGTKVLDYLYTEKPRSIVKYSQNQENKNIFRVGSAGTLGLVSDGDVQLTPQKYDNITVEKRIERAILLLKGPYFALYDLKNQKMIFDVDAKYTKIQPTDTKLFKILNENGKYALVDSDLNVLTKPIYSHFEIDNFNVFYGTIDNNRQVIQLSGM